MPKGIDGNKTNGSCECIICHYWYLNFLFQPKVRHSCHNLTQKAMIITQKIMIMAMISTTGNDYVIHFWYMSKNKDITITKNSDLSEISSSL